MASKVGVLTIIISEKEIPQTYLGTIKSCNGNVIFFKGLDLLEIAKLNGGSVKPEQLKTLAGGVGAHKDLIVDINGKQFMFVPLFENQKPAPSDKKEEN